MKIFAAWVLTLSACSTIASSPLEAPRQDDKDENVNLSASMLGGQDGRNYEFLTLEFEVTKNEICVYEAVRSNNLTRYLSPIVELNSGDLVYQETGGIPAPENKAELRLAPGEGIKVTTKFIDRFSKSDQLAVLQKGKRWRVGLTYHSCSGLTQEISYTPWYSFLSKS